jgi:polyphenol oxidase
MNQVQTVFQWCRSEEVPYGFFPALSLNGSYTHGFSNRRGGVSQGVYRSMNFWLSSEDDETHVRENFRRFTAALNTDLAMAVLTHQTHEARVKAVTDTDAGKGFTVPRDYERIDGLMTNIPGIPLMTFHADCLPIYLIDPVKRAIGLAHAGWRGTVDQIAVKMVEQMNEAYGTVPADVIVGLGPSIGECCFKVHEDVYSQFLEQLPFTKDMFIKPNDRQWAVSLQKVTRKLLHEKGVQLHNIHIANICTCCHHHLFFSQRVHGTERGTMAALLQINSEQSHRKG